MSEILNCFGKHQSQALQNGEYSRRLGADELETHAIGGGSSWFANSASRIDNVSRFSPVWRTRDISSLIPSFSFFFVIKNEETSNIFIVIDKSSE
jgi:hypothetical protein